jgi:NAD(P)-dependent dehydrogenase (short-subunit alcohol dehydrogenase family)
MAAKKVVVITGASAGVGRATAHAFGALGADVALLARGREGLEAAAGEVESRGGRALVVAADVADAKAIDAAADQVERSLGPIDIWVNNAMTSVIGPVTKISADEFRRVTEVTYLGVVHGTLSALRHMLPRDRGVIIQVGSTLGYRGIPLQAPYCAAKHAIQGFNDSLYCELLHDRSNVRLCAVNLPALNTPQFRWVRNHMPQKLQPFGTIYEPEVAAEAIVWASEHSRRELNVGWGTTQAIVANSFAPALLDRYLAQIGYDKQQTEEAEEPNRPDNLWEPVPGDGGTHGVFGDRARSISPQLWGNTHRGIAAAAVGVLAIAGLTWLRRRH